jgi:glutamate N-acetyltransferase/amino-acid N-acetyltransferase
MRAAEMASTPTDVSAIEFPPHENTVKIGVDLGVGAHGATIYGSDLTADYVAINADYRS